MNEVVANPDHAALHRLAVAITAVFDVLMQDPPIWYDILDKHFAGCRTPLLDLGDIVKTMSAKETKLFPDGLWRAVAQVCAPTRHSGIPDVRYSPTRQQTISVLADLFIELQETLSAP